MAYRQAERLAQQHRHGVPNLNQLLGLASLEDETVREGLQPRQLPRRHHARQLRVDTDPAVVFLDGGRGLVPMATPPRLLVAGIQALPLLEPRDLRAHCLAMLREDVVGRRVLGLVHQVPDRVGDRLVIGLREQRLGVIVHFPDSVPDEDDALPLLGNVIIRRAERRDRHRIADLAKVLEDFLLHLAIEHTPNALHVLADDVVRLQMVHDLHHLLVE